MAHNDYAIPYGLWGDQTVPTPTILSRLDQKASESIDGQNGGFWSPEEPIIIGGKGVQITGHATIGFIGDNGGSLETGPGALPGAIELTENYPLYQGPKVRTVLIPIVNNLQQKDFEQDITKTLGLDSAYIPYLGIDGEQPSTSSTFTAALNDAQGKIILPLPNDKLVDGALILAATLTFALVNRPSVLPSQINALPHWHIRSYARDASSVQVIANIPAWQALHAYNIGDVVQPASMISGKAFMATTAGTSGGSQPAAFASAGPNANVIEGSINWYEMSVAGDMYGTDYTFLYTSRPPVTTLFAYYNNGLPITSTMVAPNINPTIDTTNRGYFLWIDGSAFKYASLSITYQTPDMKPAA